MQRLHSYRNLTALLTGASSGIGRLLALRLAERGTRLALVARRADALERLCQEIRSAGGEAEALPCDVADREQARASVARALEQLGGVDLLVNNAGYGHHRSFLEWELSDVERMMRVNYLGSVHFTKLLLPQMLERRRGWIVFVSSVAGRIATPGESAYAASKFAMIGLARALSIEVEDSGVHVLTVCPGAIRTPFFDAEALARMPPVARRRMAEPEGLVEVILRSLEKGKREITYPRWLASAYLVQSLAPGLLRLGIRRTALEALRSGSQAEG